MFKRFVLLVTILGSFSFAYAQDIEILGNGIPIAADGSNVPSATDGTKYELTPVSANRIHDFVLNNTGQGTIQVIAITSLTTEFRVNSRIRRIRSGQSATLELAFEPTSIGAYQGTVLLLVIEGTSFRYYRFNVSGDASEASGDSEIMISQYYEKDNNDKIEIKNLTDYNIRGNNYFLVKFDSGDNLNQTPDAANVIRIGDLDPGAVVVYDDFDLNGDDVILVSTSRGRNCYTDRIDIIGTQNETWGKDISFSKGGCASETAHDNFNIDHWIALSNEEVDSALSSQNTFLGTYQSGEIIWDGTNWTSNALPDRTRTVKIDGPYSSQNLRNIEACDLIVESELDFNNDGKKSVVVYRNLSVSENGTFQLGDQESLVMYDDTAQIEGAITKIEKSTTLSNSRDFTYWSSPVSNASIGNIFSGVRSGRTYYFDQSKTTASSIDNDPEGTYWDVWVPANGTMKPGRGYASEGKADQPNMHQISFQGTPNNGIIYERVYFNEDEDDANDFNLVGNPYPSAIDIDLFFDKNEQVIDPTIYLWTHTTPLSEESGDYSSNDYATYNKTGGTGVGSGPAPEKNIGSAQGFMIRALAGVDIEFSNSMRIIDRNDQFFKSRVVEKKNKDHQIDRIWLDLTTNKGGFNQILIGFINGASVAYDPGYDAVKNQGSNKISFYTLLDDKKLAIQGLGRFELRAEVPLGFDTKVTNRTYTIAVSAVEGQLRDAEIILHDHYLHKDHNLKNSNYSFEEINQGSYPERFSLRFERPVHPLIENELNEKEMIVYNQGDVFNIETTKKVETIRMYDLNGNIVLEKHPRNSSFELIEPSSRRGDVLLMQVIYDDQSNQMKKVYKR